MLLSDLKPGQSATIVKVLGHSAFRRRMIEMGFVKGRNITDLLSAPLMDPVKYSLMGYEVSLRRAEAAMVEVQPADAPLVESHSHGTAPHEALPGALHADNTHTINVALVGNPNCGKTSLFNIVSGAREHTGNYSGVTVDAKTGHIRHGEYTINIVDLPGTYSLTTYSPEERYVRHYLRDSRPDIVVNVVDASNLERNLYLTTELIDMNIPMVICLNMYDELEASGTRFDYSSLAAMIGVPIVPTTARTGRGTGRLLDTIVDIFEDRHPDTRHIHISFCPELEASVKAVNDALKASAVLRPDVSPRYLAIKLLEQDPDIEAEMRQTPGGNRVLEVRDAELQHLRRLLPGEDVTELVANDKYGFIQGALAETMEPGEKSTAQVTRLVDTIVTNRLLGFPIFLLLMAAMFWATFELGSYPMEWIEAGVTWLGELVADTLPRGWLRDLIVDGIIGGVGGVIVFLPNILILYFCISFMEDSGYMARAAFIMDRIMHRMGVHGKSFIPLLMGFGCNVPAIMAARTIESRSSRLITILINPFMSCSARLPVYVLLVGIFFPTHATLTMMLLYLGGVAVAVITARLLRRFWFGADETPFVMELPPYRIPTMKASLRHTWAKGEQYLRKMGGIILIASIAVWALNYFPLRSEMSSTPGFELADELRDDRAIDPERDSYLEMAGKAVNPVMEPLGFSWRATVAALAGVPAKEIVVSTLGVLYTGDPEATDRTLSARITTPNPVTGHPDFTAASAAALMVFILLYCPCLATIVAIIRQTGNWGWGLFSVLYNTAVAWLAAWGVYRIMLLL